MATIQELKRQIENANALGIKNLADKGVGFAGFSPTTYEIMQGIADIIRDGGDDNGGGIQYTSITYNDDDTITMIDTDGVTHTMVCVYEDDKLSSVTYDGKEIKLHYTDDALDMVGKTEVNLSNAKSSGVATVDHTVTFLADGKPYEVVSVKDGNTVNAPSGIPTSKDGTFTKWLLDGQTAPLPYPPEKDDEIIALFQTVRSEISTDKAGTYLGSALGTKSNDGFCICGYFQESAGSSWYYYDVVGKTPEAVKTTNVAHTFTVEYEGEIWYLASAQIHGTPDINADIKLEQIPKSENPVYATARMTALLDYYFMKT
jgi:hypothetical protein